jgi:hypothetical protein
MPWFEPCANLGYTKFLTNPDLRQDRWIVSDTYLQALLSAYRQGYTNAGGPDFEDSDDVLLDKLAANCVSSTSAAASLGQQDAGADVSAGQTVHTSGYTAGATIGPTPATGTPEANATVYTKPTLQGQPLQPTMMEPTMFGAPSMASGGGALTSFSGSGGGPSPTIAGIPFNWLLLAAAALGAWLLLREK